MKTFLYIVLLAFLSYCCNNSTRDKKPGEEDSLQYYPVTPEKLTSRNSGNTIGD
ncbi:MAG: hypothetical protein IPK57_05575 [Chitinophagaceae bacterium]|nr:hypothetical protein [Chitinophagaceae bacterium]